MKQPHQAIAVVAPVSSARTKLQQAAAPARSAAHAAPILDPHDANTGAGARGGQRTGGFGAFVDAKP